MIHRSKPVRDALVLCAVCGALAASSWWLTRQQHTTNPQKDGSLFTASGQAAPSPLLHSNGTNVFALFPTFRRHPFAVARESSSFQWTAEDGRNTNILRRLAHNELEYQRMADESYRIFRRQLVYHKETLDARIQRSRLTGEAIRTIALPGLDGQEIQVEITRTDLNPSGQQGTFSGHVVDRLDSFVTFAFKDGHEAFTILSPSDGLYIQGDPREPGELLVKSIDPQTYIVGTCGNP